MRYKAIAGHSDNELCLAMECSRCGVSLRRYANDIEKIKYCPECGRKLVHLKPSISYAKIVDMLNAQEGGDE